MKSKILSFLLVVAIVFSCISQVSFAEGEITVYFTMSKFGEIVTSSGGSPVALLEIELSGKESYTLSDVFKEAHKKLCPNGISGYSEGSSQYGAYVTKLWGDESGQFGYQVNGGEISVLGPTQEVSDGDYVDACIYKNAYPQTESYSKFDAYKKQAKTNESVTIKLFEAGYDGFWSIVFSPCKSAEITINGEKTSIFTDESGEATLSFKSGGEYIVSAIKTKEFNEETIPSLTAPVMKITVLEDADTVIHNIAEKYTSNAILTDENLPWLVIDLAGYNEAYPNSKNVISNKLRQEISDKLIAFSESATKPSDLAKAILAIRSMGYNPKEIYNKYANKVNVVKKLTTLVDRKDSAVSNPYTLPYVIMALWEYSTPKQTDYLIAEAISNKALWQDTTYGSDGITPMLIALSKFTDRSEVKAIINESIPKVKDLILPSGLINSMGEAASTGLAIAGFSAVGEDTESLVQGLLTKQNDAKNGFLPTENSFSTEQGFRGLVASKLSRSIFDFSSFPSSVVYQTQEKKEDISQGGGGTSSSKTKTTKNETKTASAVPLQPVSEPKTTLSYSDVTENDWFYNSVKFVSEKGLMKGTEVGFEPYLPVSRAMLVSVLYRLSGSEEKFITGNFTDVYSGDWYFDAVNWASANGIVKGVTESEFAPKNDVTREQIAVILYRYAKAENKDADLSKFTDVSEISEYAIPSVKWAISSEIINGDTENKINPKETTTRAQLAVILERFCNMAGDK